MPGLVLALPFPNPAPGRVSLPIALAGPAPVEVIVFDLAGRARRRIWDGGLAAGAHRLDWDGRDDAGRVMASGIYFVRARSPLGESSARLTLLRP